MECVMSPRLVDFDLVAWTWEMAALHHIITSHYDESFPLTFVTLQSLQLTTGKQVYPCFAPLFRDYSLVAFL